MSIKPLKTTITVKYKGDSLQLKSNNKAGFNYLLDYLEGDEDLTISHAEDTGYLVMVTPLNGITNDDVLGYLLNETEDSELNIKFKGAPKATLLKLRLLFNNVYAAHAGMWLLSVLIVASGFNEVIFIIAQILACTIIVVGLSAALLLALDYYPSVNK